MNKDLKLIGIYNLLWSTAKKDQNISWEYKNKE